MVRRGLGAVDPFTASLIIGGINTGLSALLNRKSGVQKELASNIVDQAEVELKRLVATWEMTEPKTVELQNQVLNIVLQTFDKVKALLMDPQLGDHGQRAIIERFGTYDPITGQGVGGTGGNGWSDWWTYYWFPVKDSVVVTVGYGDNGGGDGVVNSGGNGVMPTGRSINWLPIALIGGGLVVAYTMLGD